MPLKLSSRLVDGVTVVYCVGRLVAGDEVNDFRMLLKSLLPENAKIVLNFQNVEYIDSGGIGTLVGLCTSARRVGGDLKLCCVNQRVMRVLRLTKLHTVLSISEQEEEAVRAYRKFAVSA